MRTGTFTDRHVRPSAALSQVLRCGVGQAREIVRLSEKLFPTSLGGIPLPAAYEATAAAVTAGTIDLEHATVIEELLSSRAAGRLEAGQWAIAEAKLAEWAEVYTPHTLRKQGTEYLDLLDQDGAEPDPGDDHQTNELRLTRDHRGHGGWIKARLDSATYDALSQAIEGLTQPERLSEGKSLAERQADALAEMAEAFLGSGTLPEVKTERPHLTMILKKEEYAQRIKSGSLTATGCRIGPKEIARIACDAQLILLLLNGETRKIDQYVEARTASTAQRRALAARDRGCAFPGCDRPIHRCEAHHIKQFSRGGETTLDNLALLCLTHHQAVHGGGWTVDMHDGLPRFIPPRWLDSEQKPRQKPSPYLD